MDSPMFLLHQKIERGPKFFLLKIIILKKIKNKKNNKTWAHILYFMD
jgi:hypothetical protein